jgi:hypothetical protein
MDSAAATAKRVALAHNLLSMAQSETWQTVILPYLQGERDVMIETMASMTDSLQLMRYAGSVQTLTSLIGLEGRAKQVIAAGLEQKLEKFH